MPPGAYPEEDQAGGHESSNLSPRPWPSAYMVTAAPPSVSLYLSPPRAGVYDVPASDCACGCTWAPAACSLRQRLRSMPGFNACHPHPCDSANIAQQRRRLSERYDTMITMRDVCGLYHDKHEGD